MPGVGAATVVAGAVYNRYSALGWTSSLTVQNVDVGATTVEMVFGDGTVTRLTGIAPGQSRLVYLPEVSGLTVGWYGSALVRSLDGRRVAVVANADTLGAGAQGDWLISYPAAER